jgi:hypothetical protein
LNSSAPNPTPDAGEMLVQPRGPRFFARNRRDGARLLSSTLTIAVIGLVGWQHTAGRVVASIAGALSLFWWLQYRQLKQ